MKTIVTDEIIGSIPNRAIDIFGHTISYENIEELKIAVGHKVGDTVRTVSHTDGGINGAIYIARAVGLHTDGLEGQVIDSTFVNGINVQWEYVPTSTDAITLEDLAALTPEIDGSVFYVFGDGAYVWRAGDQSTNIPHGAWVVPDSDPTGVSGAFQKMSLTGMYTDIELNDNLSPINVIGKYTGKPAWNMTTGTPIWATGADPEDPWIDGCGVTTNSPTDYYLVSISDAETVVEADTGSVIMSFPLTMNHPSDGDTTVSYTVTGTATDGVDFTTPSGTAVISDGELTGTVDIEVLGDTDIEDAETVIITLDSADNNAALGAVTVGTGIIAHDDPA